MQLESVIAVVAGVAALAVILWPRVGVAARLWRAADAAERIRVEDAVKHLFTSEAAHRPSSVESLAGAVGLLATVLRGPRRHWAHDQWTQGHWQHGRWKHDLGDHGSSDDHGSGSMHRWH